MTIERKRNEDGQFISSKPREPSKGGRPKSEDKLRKEADQAMYDILREAKGDPIKIMELSLERGADLLLSRNEVFKLCDKLAPYKEARLSATEVTEKKVTAYIMEFPGINDSDQIKTIEGVPNDSTE